MRFLSAAAVAAAAAAAAAPLAAAVRVAPGAAAGAHTAWRAAAAFEAAAKDAHAAAGAGVQGAWAALADAPTAFYEGHAVLLPDGRVAWPGGADPSQGAMGDVASVAVYDPASDSWGSLPDLPRAREMQAAGMVKDTLYVFGGFEVVPVAALNGSAYTMAQGSVFSLDTSDAQAKWVEEAGAPLPYNSTGAASITLPGGEATVIVGGFQNWFEEGGVLNFAYHNETYLFDGSSYTALPAYPYQRSNLMAVAANGGVYAFGGGSTAPSYDTCAFLKVSAARAADGGELRVASADAWAPCASLPAPTTSAAAGVAKVGDDEYIVMLGGLDGNFDLTLMGFVYNPKTDSWGSLVGGNLKAPTGFVNGASMPDGSFLMAGGAYPGVPKPGHTLQLTLSPEEVGGMQGMAGEAASA